MTHQQRQQQTNSNRMKDRNSSSSKGKHNNFLRLSLPGLGLLRKFQQYRRLPQEPPPAPPANGGHHLEEELDRLTGKIDNLLCKIEGQDQEAARGHEEECVVCGINRASMQTLPCSHQVVCRKCFVRTIQMAVAQKRLPLRCIMCRAKVLKIKQNQRNQDGAVTAKHEICDDGLPKSVSGYNINNNISYSGSNYSFTSGVSAVSSESTSSRKCSLTRDFSFSSLSNFQNVNLLDKSQIPRSKSSNFGSRRTRRSRSPSPKGGSRSKSVEGVPPIIRIERTPSDESLCCPTPSPSSPLAPPLSPIESFSRSPSSSSERFSRSPRSPTSPTNDPDRIYSRSSRLSVSTPLSPIKESRKETESLLDFNNSPIKEIKIQHAAVPQKQSSRIRCAEKILTQLEMDTFQQHSYNNQKEATFNTTNQDNHPENRQQQSNHKIPRTVNKQTKTVTFKDC